MEWKRRNEKVAADAVDAEARMIRGAGYLRAPRNFSPFMAKSETTKPPS
jgi:hypothetical protein